MQTSKQKLVYLIQDKSGRVKIGVSVNPKKRLAQLQTSHSDILTLLATCPGGEALERELHGRYFWARTSGEWFDMKSFEFDELKSEMTIRSELPAAPILPPERIHPRLQYSILHLHGFDDFDAFAAQFERLCNTPYSIAFQMEIMMHVASIGQLTNIVNALTGAANE